MAQLKSGTTIAGSTAWHAGNDGSGSGLDADLLDGQQASSFAQASHTHNYLPLSGGTLTGTINYGDVSRYWLATATNWGIYWDTTNNQIEFHGAGTSRFNFDLDDGYAYHAWSDLSGGVKIGSEVILQESSDRADLLQITSSTSGWGGLQIRNSSNEGRWSFMTDGESAGIYNDEDEKWHIYMTEGGSTEIKHGDGNTKLSTSTSGVTINGNTNIAGTLYIGGVDVIGEIASALNIINGENI